MTETAEMFFEEARIIAEKSKALPPEQQLQPTESLPPLSADAIKGMMAFHNFLESAIIFINGESLDMAPGMTLDGLTR